MENNSLLLFIRIALILVLCRILGCSDNAELRSGEASEQPGIKASQQPAKTSGFLRLKRFEIIDTEGFGTPVVVLSFLAPADWELEGGVRWNVNSQCVFELVSIHARVRDREDRRAFEIFPKYVSDWVNDPQMAQMMSGTQPCRVAPPLRSSEFVSRAFVPGFRPGATIVETRQRTGAAEAQYRKTMAIEGAEIARYGSRLDVDATQSRIAYHSEKGSMEEWVLATSSVLSVPMLTGFQQGLNQMTFVENVLGFRTPSGELDANERLFTTIIASFQINPAYEMAVRNVIMRVGEIQIQGQMALLQSIREQNRRLFRDWNASIDRRDAEWTQRMAVQDQVYRQFNEAIRGTQSFTDPHSPDQAWEMTNDFEYVWKTANDEFILTNDINYNPNVDLNSNDREQMRRSR